MTIKECYDRMGADYESVLHCLNSEERIPKFLKMLVSDNNFSDLSTALENKDYEDAFRAAHTIKGVALNLRLTRLAKSSSDLTEALRDKCRNEAINRLFVQLKNDYLEMQTVVGELLNGPEREAENENEK